MGLTKLGNNTLTLTGANTFSGPTIVSGGTLDLDNSNALQNSMLIASSGTVAFDPGVASKTFSFGGLSGAGNLSLQNTAGIALTGAAIAEHNVFRQLERVRFVDPDRQRYAYTCRYEHLSRRHHGCRWNA